MLRFLFISFLFLFSHCYFITLNGNKKFKIKLLSKQENLFRDPYDTILYNTLNKTINTTVNKLFNYKNVRKLYDRSLEQDN